MTISEKGRFREVDHEQDERGQQCSAIRILNLTGPLFAPSRWQGSIAAVRSVLLPPISPLKRHSGIVLRCKACLG